MLRNAYPLGYINWGREKMQYYYRLRTKSDPLQQFSIRELPYTILSEVGVHFYFARTEEDAKRAVRNRNVIARRAQHA